MFPSLLAKEITQGLKNFITTGFETSSPVFAGMFTRFVEQSGEFIKGPYLSLDLPFKQGDTHRHFFENIDTAFIPYIHQKQAWERISTVHQGLSTLIATGTSSGKTECFLYPILEHCLNASEPGIKAIIIYPMNALATDQAHRFAQTIAGLGDVEKSIRVGLYIGESEENPTKKMTADAVITDKNTIKSNPPDILLTNYKMLDFLMLRPGDQALWQENSKTALRYLVVDELHTFDGAQGTDLACLIRRLKAKLGVPKEHLICVGTSATLGSKGENGNEGSGEEGDPLRSFAQRIFQETFDRQSIIAESRQSVSEFLNAIPITYTFISESGLAEKLEPLNYDSVTDYLKAQYELFFPGQPEAEVNDPTWCCQLGEQLKQHLLFYNLLQLLASQPVELDVLISEMAKVLPTGEAQTQSEAILNSLCALIALSRLRDSDNQQRILPLVNLRMQLWIRELRRMVAPLRGDADDDNNSDSKQIKLSFADDHKNEKQRIYLPLVQCNTCHSTAWLAVKPNAQQHIQHDLRSIYNAFFQNSPDSVLLFPMQHEEDFTSRGNRKSLCTSCGHLQTGDLSCKACGEEDLQAVFIPETVKEKTIKGVPRLVSEPFCPVCDSHNSLIVFGARATSLSSVAIQHDFASLYNNDKKLITFSDSVQDAAHLAGFFSARTWQNNIRMAMAQALPDATIPLQEFYTHFPAYWQDKNINPSALDTFTFISEFIAPNMLWYRDYVYLTENEQLPPESDLIYSISRRLQWEVLAEFGYRSRIGRSLEQVGIAVLGIDTVPVQRVTDNVMLLLQEQLGFRELTHKIVSHFIWGFLFYLKRRGAIYHPFLNAYIHSGGKTFLLNKQTWLPSFARKTQAPLFLMMNNKGTEFDGLVSKKGESWYQKWCRKTLGHNGLFPDKFETNVYALLIKALLDDRVLIDHECKGEAVWALNPEVLFLSRNTVRLQTPHSKDAMVIPDSLLNDVEGMPSLISEDFGCYQKAEHYKEPGEYKEVNSRNEHWLAQIYRRGDLCRVIAQEHTGLLERENRELLEHQFIHGDKPWYPNLLSATPTLEMGINIGDLSSVLLASVPPAQANYLQRIGRAGRKDGNAFNLTVAGGQPHDLYFFSQPTQMMTGKIEPPGVFLNASAVIARQLTAFCFDRWVATGISESAIPLSLKPVLDNVQVSELKKFPYNYLQFVKQNAIELLDNFLLLFDNDLTVNSIRYLKQFLYGERIFEDMSPDENADAHEVENIELYIVKRLSELLKERERLKKRIAELKRYIDKLKKKPQDEAIQEEIEQAYQERSGLQAILRNINKKQTFNFLTDEGLLPNYAFPEAGVMLRSVIYRRKNTPADGESLFENVVYEYERPGAAAISELAPLNRFYAGGRQVSIAQIDMQLSEIEYWRFCRQCSYSENVTTGDHHEVCPRCSDLMWTDSGQRVQMLRLRQVMANTSDKESRIGDEVEDREPAFYTRQMLADFDAQYIEKAWRLVSDQLPFGFEFIKKSSFREINFGEYSLHGEELQIAGEPLSRPGFKVCRYCGMVQKKTEKNQQHAFACKAPDSQLAENLIECLYLYREFTSEAVRILLPVFSVESAQRYLNSFIAAIQLGLKRKFGGQVDHIKVMTYDEPLSDGADHSDSRRHYLMLYDSVPGGTGYLHELLQTPQHLMEIFQLSKEVLVSCSCNQEPQKDGCYQCLYAYRNSYGMETTSRNTAVELLGSILESADKYEEVDTISAIKVNPAFDSELEARFIEAIRRFGMKNNIKIQQQVVNGKAGFFLSVKDRMYEMEPQFLLSSQRGDDQDGVIYSCKPDFLIRSARSSDKFKPIAVFLDGFQYHKKRITDDTAKRLSLVQSGQYLQWSLTWQDVNEQVVTTHLSSSQEIRNPFREQIQTEMQPLQTTLCDQLHVSDIFNVPLLSPFEQLFRYLEEPEPQRWMNMAFIRSLLWYEKIKMLDTNFKDTVIEDFEKYSPTAFNALIDISSDFAVSRKVIDQNDPLTVLGITPLAAISISEAESHFLNIIFDTSLDDVIEEEEFKDAWLALLQAYNIFQFLPKTGFTTFAGIEQGVYESINFTFAQKGYASKHRDEIQDIKLESLLAETFEEFESGLRKIRALNLPLPVAGYELIDESSSEIIADAELVWLEQKIAAILEEQKEFSGKFTERGWVVILLDNNNQWIDSLTSILNDFLDK